jgi:hypothetical protein
MAPTSLLAVHNQPLSTHVLLAKREDGLAPLYISLSVDTRQWCCVLDQ